MSIKSQNRLPIFALVIVGLTVLSLFGINYAVETISQTKPASIAYQAPIKQPPSNFVIDDSVERRNKPKPTKIERSNKKLEKPTKRTRRPNIRRGNGQDSVKRKLGNGPSPQNIERPKRRRKENQNNRQPERRIIYPPQVRDRYFPPIPEGLDLDENEREMIEEEMRRRQREGERYPDNFPPPGFPPPGYPPPGYDPNEENENGEFYYQDPDEFEDEARNEYDRESGDSEYDEQYREEIYETIKAARIFEDEFIDERDRLEDDYYYFEDDYADEYGEDYEDYDY